MRKREVIKIDDKEIVLKELTVMELIYLCHRTGWIKIPQNIDEKQFEKYKDIPVYDVVLTFISDISKNEIMLFAPSEIKTLYNAFKNVNSVTFETAKYMGVGKLIDDMREGLVKHFMSDYSKLLKG